MNKTMHTGDEGDPDFPVLTDIIDEGSIKTEYAAAPAATASLPSLEQIEADLSARLSAELALQIPVLIEAALREHLPRAMGAKLQAELLTVLANALPGAAQNASAELSSSLAFEVGGVLEQRLAEEVKRAVSDEIARITDHHQLPR